MPNSFASPVARISEDASVHLGGFLLERLTDLSHEDIQTVFQANADDGSPCVDRALQASTGFLENLSQNPDQVAILRDLGAAFSAARDLDHSPPGDMSQAYWNRLLRDQGERLRAAALTLAAGRADVATSQLSRVRGFLREHLLDLPL